MSKNYTGLGKILVGIILILMLQAFHAKAAPGDPDPAFPANSVRFPIYGDYSGLAMNRIEVLSDGKYLVAGFMGYSEPNLPDRADRLILRRHNADGSLDTSFGRNGDVVEYIGFGQYRRIKMSRPSRIAVQPDGKILIGGKRHSDDGQVLGLSVWRFTADGFLDETFDGDGRKDLTDLMTQFPDPSAEVETIKVVKSNEFSLEPLKIYVLCTYNNINDYYIESKSLADSSKLIKLNLNGGYDTDFGSSGKAFLSGEFNDIAIYKQLSLANELIYLAGIGEDNTLTVWRYTKDGFPDTTFAANGRSSLPFDYYKRRFENILIQKDGKLLLSGDFNPTQGIIMNHIMRMNPNGVFDQQFGNATISGVGAVTRPHVFNFSIAQQSDGKFIVGYSPKRYFRDGTLDESYIVPNSYSNELNSFTIQKDNKLVNVDAYWESNVGNRSYVISRMLP